MSGGDGTGPFGTGSLKGRTGRHWSRGRRFGLDGDCPRTGPGQKGNNTGFGKRRKMELLPNSLLRIPSLIMSIAAVAVPVIVTIREMLQKRRTESRLDSEEFSSNTITIEAEVVESEPIENRDRKKLTKND